MRRPGIKRKKKKAWRSYSIDNCQQRHCPRCYNNYCSHRKSFREIKGYDVPKKKYYSPAKEQAAVKNKQKRNKMIRRALKLFLNIILGLVSLILLFIYFRYVF